MTDSYIEVISDAISDLKAQKDIRMETDDLSTMLIGSSDMIFNLLAKCFLKASKITNHVVLNVTFSAGCPGEPNEPCCNIEEFNKSKNKKSNVIKLSGINVSAQFAIYPLNNPDYMDIIYREIEKSRKFAAVQSKHYCTRIDGDIKNIFTTLQQSFENASNDAKHVVMTVILSKKGDKHII